MGSRCEITPTRVCPKIVKTQKPRDFPFPAKVSEALLIIFQVVSRLESAYFFQSSICLVDGSGAGSEFSFFVSVQFQFNDFLDTVLAKDNGNTDADIRFAVFTFQIYRAGSSSSGCG